MQGDTDTRVRRRTLINSAEGGMRTMERERSKGAEVKGEWEYFYSTHQGLVSGKKDVVEDLRRRSLIPVSS